MDKRKLVISVLLEGHELPVKEIAEKISAKTGESFESRDFSALVTRMANEKLCDLGYFITKSKSGDRFVYKIADEATALSEDQAYGLAFKDGNYDLVRALKDFPELKKYVGDGGIPEAKDAEKTKKAANRKTADTSETSESAGESGGGEQPADPPVYVSAPSVKNFWQEYRVYPDRVELDCKLLFQTIIIPSDEIADIESRPPLAFLDVFRGKSIKQAFAFKFDGADLNQHVVIERKNGLMKCIRFTPDDPDRFIEACKSILK